MNKICKLKTNTELLKLLLEWNLYPDDESNWVPLVRFHTSKRDTASYPQWEYHYHTGALFDLSPIGDQMKS